MRLGGLLRRRAAGVEGEEKRPPGEAPGPAVEQQLRQIPVDAIVASPFQPRAGLDEQALEELAASIAANGLLQPLVVRPKEGGFELVTGERRWRAVKRLGWSTVPAIVRELSDEDAAALAMIENLQREDLNAIEEAQGYRTLLEQFHWTQTELARRMGKSQSTIANKLRLLKLPPSVQERILRRTLTERHARALLRIEDPSVQEKLAEQAEKAGWTVEETERRVEEYLGGKGKAAGKGVRKNRRVVRVFKDMRLFRNSIMSVVRDMERTGLVVEVEESVDSDVSGERWQIRLSVRRMKE
ncbi:MAG: ParB/RepB/Spo0J family partition protein [Limnochordales bacterium]|nr:nucleoid occlusion protein [Bacillota bacterium]